MDVFSSWQVRGSVGSDITVRAPPSLTALSPAQKYTITHRYYTLVSTQEGRRKAFYALYMGHNCD